MFSSSHWPEERSKTGAIWLLGCTNTAQCRLMTGFLVITSPQYIALELEGCCPNHMYMELSPTELIGLINVFLLKCGEWLS